LGSIWARASSKHQLPLHQLFEDKPMFELAIAVIAAISLRIFLVHAVETYLTHQPGSF
jgi:hypothetical protein